MKARGVLCEVQSENLHIM